MELKKLKAELAPSLGTLKSQPLQTQRLTDGKRELTRELVVEVDGEQIVVEKGFVTDFSSYPMMAFVGILTLFAAIFPNGWLAFPLLFLVPKYSKVDIAGVVHDYFYQRGGKSKYAADKIWYQLAMAGDHRANFFQAFAGRWVGLFVFGWGMWWHHRKSREANTSNAR